MDQQPTPPANTPPPDSTAWEELAPGVRVPAAALEVTFSRSGGPGGQHVNTASTRAQLRVDLDRLGLTPEVRTRLEALAGSRLTEQGEIVLASSVHRSQRLNAMECRERLAELIRRARVRPKARKPTKPTAGAKRRRIEGKKRRGEIKRQRRRPSGE